MLMSTAWHSTTELSILHGDNKMPTMTMSTAYDQGMAGTVKCINQEASKPSKSPEHWPEMFLVLLSCSSLASITSVRFLLSSTSSFSNCSSTRSSSPSVPGLLWLFLTLFIQSQFQYNLPLLAWSAVVVFNPFYFSLNFSTVLPFTLHFCSLQTQTQSAFANSNLLSLSQTVLHRNPTFFFPPQQNGSDSLKTCVTTCCSHASALLCNCKMTALWSKKQQHSVGCVCVFT